MTTNRFLIAVGVTLFAFLSDFGAGLPKTNRAQAAEQKTTEHPSAPHLSTGHPSMGYKNTSRSGSAHSGVKTGGQTATQLPNAMAAHRTNAVLKGEVQTTSSKIQQQVIASGNGHHWHHHWHWGQYGCLPTNSSSLVVGVPSGNTLSVALAGAVVPSVRLAGVAAPMTNAGSLAQRVALGGVAAPLAGPMINAGRVQRVRLAGVAAPVAGQAFSSESQQHLSAMANGKHVRIFQTGVDADGTIVAQVFLSNSGIHLNERQLRDGMAFNSVNDGFASSLAAAEEAALTARTGLWKAKHPIAPWLATN
jgi:endonuclease YncB( thermonuclease family)